MSLYNVASQSWEVLVIDDRVPSRSNRSGELSALFATPHSNELYVLLLEKAFAKPALWPCQVGPKEMGLEGVARRDPP